MPPAGQFISAILAAIFLVSSSVSASSKTINNLSAASLKSSNDKSFTDQSTSSSMNNNQIAPVRLLPQQHLTSNIYQSQSSYLSPSRDALVRRSQPQASMQTASSHHQIGDLSTAAGHHHKHHKPHGKYYEYREVPHKKAWKFGYKRGNHKHTIERHEHGKGPHFKTKVKWHDKKGKGVHLWDYNHYDKKKKHYG